MAKYGFILGKKPLLSLAEILSVVDKKSLQTFEKNLAIIESDETEKEMRKKLERLGGTIKIFSIEKQYDEFPDMDDLIEESVRIVTSRAQNKKYTLALEKIEIEAKNEEDLSKFLKTLKKRCAQEGVTTRYLESQGSNSTATFVYEDLLENGTEFVVAQMEKRVILGRTIAVQNIESYGERDYEKPFRDAKNGMLPPKLAQMMINLGRNITQKKDPIVYDPFCGSGTVLLEAMTQGMASIGSDASGKQVNGSHENIEWMYEKMTKQGIDTIKSIVFQQDIKILSQENFKSFDAPLPDLVVTESFLGPPLNRPTPEQIANSQEIISELYVKTIERLALLQIPIVIAIAAHRGPSGWIFNDAIMEAIKRHHYEVIPPLPNWITKRATSAALLRDGLIPHRQTLLYDRPDQSVAREIFRLKPKSNS